MIRLIARLACRSPSTLLAPFIGVTLGVTLISATALLAQTSSRADESGRHRLVAATVVVRADGAIRAPGVDGDAPDTIEAPAAPRLAAAWAARIAAVPGVRAAVPDLSFSVWMPNGRSRATRTAATSGHPWSSAALTPFALRAGRSPSSSGQVVLTADLARARSVAVGDPVDIVTARQGPTTFRVAGIAAATGRIVSASGSAVFFSAGTAERLAGARGHVDAIGVLGDPGLTAAVLAERVRRRLAGARLRVLTSTEAARLATADRPSSLRALSDVLGALGGIGSFVAIFVVASTYNLLVVRRTRQIGLLRTIGATAGQIRLIIAGEALIVSLAAGLAGSAGGIALAGLVVRILADGGAARLYVGPGPLLAGVAVGTATSLVAVLVAARRAARIDPLEALREAANEDRSVTRPRCVCGVLTLVAGVLLLLSSVRMGGEEGAGQTVAAAMVLAVAAALLGPLGVRPVAWGAEALGGGRRRATARLARASAAAHPRRTAASAAPMTLAITLACMLLFGTSTLDRFTEEENRRRVRADDLLVPARGNGLPRPLLDAARALPGVGTATGVRGTRIVEAWNPHVGIRERAAVGVDPSAIGRVLDLDVRAGSLASLRGGAIAVGEERARQAGWRVGDGVDVWMADGARRRLRIVALYGRTAGFAELLLPLTLVDAHGKEPLRDQIYLRATREADRGRLHAGLESLRTVYPMAEALSRARYLARYRPRAPMDALALQLLAGLCVAYAMIATMNNLAMGFRGREEFSLLRRIGATRGQVLRIVGGEMLIVVALGVGFGTLISAVCLGGLGVALSGSPSFAASPTVYATVVLSCLGLSWLATVPPTRRAASGRSHRDGEL